MDMLKEGLVWLERQRRAHLTSPVEYWPVDGSMTLPLEATVGRTDFELADPSGATIRTHITDFLIARAELGREPQPGDVIVAEGRRFEVTALTGEGVWRWSDPYQQTYRIHTRDVGAQL